MNESYALTYSVDYPDRELNRLTTFFRLFTAIPIVIVLSTLQAANSGILFLSTLLMILFRKRYPRWWFDWNREFTRFAFRIQAYVALMSDTYPSTDEHQYVQLELRYPNVETDLARGMPLIKWLLAIPHYIVLLFLWIAAIVCVVIAWFAILFTGRYPRSLFEFVAAVQRWALRVAAYAFLLVTDEYPPFSLEP